jgi:hypothetical protein
MNGNKGIRFRGWGQEDFGAGVGPGEHDLWRRVGVRGLQRSFAGFRRLKSPFLATNARNGGHTGSGRAQGLSTAFGCRLTSLEMTVTHDAPGAALAGVRRAMLLK